MNSHLDRAELVARLQTELAQSTAGPEDPQLAAFAKTLLRRVDDAYLFRHRLTTLGAQLRDSYRWFLEAAPRSNIEVRVFRPTLAANGYQVEGVVIETLMPDQPFIYDTLKLALEASQIRVLNNLRVVVPIHFDALRKVTDIGDNGEVTEPYGYTRWYVTWEGAPELEELAALLRVRLTAARAMVGDFQRMLREVRAIANEFDYLATLEGSPRADCLEIKEFLHWLQDEHFVFMGLTTLARNGAELQPTPERALGLAREPAALPIDNASLAFMQQTSTLQWPLARVHKSAIDSTIHRRGKIDEILIRTYDPDGKPTGGVVLHGLFTFKGLVESGSDIPILRRKLDHLIGAEGLTEGDYDHKGLLAAFNALPVEYLFEADEPAISALLKMARAADDRHEFRCHIAPSGDRHSAYVFVVLPKENYTDELRAELQSALQAELGANYADHRVHFGKYGSVAVHFYLTSGAPLPAGDFAGLEQRLGELGTPWTQRLRRALEVEFGEAGAAEHFARYADAFHEAYMEETAVALAVADLIHLEAVRDTGKVAFDIFPSPGGDEDALLRIYSARELLLTEILPVVDNFGVVVAEQVAFDVHPTHSPTTLQINTLRVRRGDPDLLAQRSELVDALTAVFERRMRSDRINRLLLRARLSWQEVELFRAYFYYSRQLGSQMIPEVVQKVLIHQAEFVHRLAELFRVRFDPKQFDSLETRATQQAVLVEGLRKYLDGVKGFDEDRILRTFFNLILATVRTNFYRARSGDTHYTSFKVRCADVADMPAPRPLYEIYVHATQVEGVHLRGGKVARGGIRWSDRLDDYRSEVLGLMATQMLKNAVIVPVGAKGGFVLKTPPEDWAEAREQADFYYKVFIRGLLDVTDNIVAGQVVPPPDVIRHDEPDPYLVVAADKGTAHLSDTANGLAAEYKFWLDDAFASGGSLGYDHKIKGITARSGWACVERHFREMGMDPNKDPITIIGIGDMSGDVFGNGLLLSHSARLIGAFDHRHIFLDPDPDPEVSFQERARLFALKRSSWRDYDPTLISAGGGVWERGAKAIKLSPELRKRLGAALEKAGDEVSGEELIRCLLTADVDLLWNGGIGTYFKASTESHADVKDTANDRVRIDANRLRCRVIGEGGNLGMTIRARVEFASLGGRCNLDAIDNSGGVDLSDHEVNIKTLLHHPLSTGRLTRDERNRLVIAVGDEACRSVMLDSIGQALAISLDEVRSRRDIWSFQHAMLALRDRLGFSRYGEHLPRNPDVVKQRLELGRGFYRPELGKLLSYAKMHLARGVINAPIGDRAALLPYVASYFPAAIVEAQADALDHHFLFHEIAGTVITNRIVDQAGITFVALTEVATDKTTSEVAAAYLLAEECLGAGSLRQALRDSTAVTEVVYPALIRLEDTLAALTRAILWTSREAVTLATRARLAPLRAAIAAVAGEATTLIPERALRAIRDDEKALQASLSPELAHQVAQLPIVQHAAWIAHLAEVRTVDPRTAAEAYFGAGYACSVLDLALAIDRQGYQDRWDFVATWPILRGLYESAVALAGLQLTRGIEVLKTLRIPELATSIDEVLRDRVPVSAMLVLSERLRDRIRQAT